MCYNITNAINNEYMECFYDYLKYFGLEMVENSNKLVNFLTINPLELGNSIAF